MSKLQVLLVDGDADLDKDAWAARLEEAGHKISLVVGAHDPISYYQGQKVAHPDLPVVVLSNEEPLFSTTMCGPFQGVSCIPPEDVENGLAAALKASSATCNLGGGEARHPVIIGRSSAIQEIRHKIRAVANKPVTVLITGESGTGKELIARSIHCHSNRSNKPLVKVNCGALPDTLLESEVFGYQRGAFTGAHADKPGRLETAHQGTLFVDEIGALPLQLQVKFLQVLEEKVFSRLGGVKDHTIETRVIAATNADLLNQVHQGLFRKDLYYRLAVIHIQVPPLRERSPDIPLLVHYFLHKYAVELRRTVPEPPEEVSRLLSRYTWPGNVRELENIMRRAVVMEDWGFINEFMSQNPGAEESEPGDPGDPEQGLTVWTEKTIQSFLSRKGATLKTLVKAYIEDLERTAIENALKQVQWNRRQAADLLGVSYKTLLNRITALDLHKNNHP